MSFIDNISNKLNLIFKQLIIIMLYIGLSLLLSSLFFNLLKSNNFYIVNLSYILIDLITLIVFLLIFRKTIIPSFNDFKKNKSEYFNKYLKYWLIGLIIMIVSNSIINSFIGLPSNEAGNREILMDLPIYSLLSMVIISPIVEELMTRVILKDAFKHQVIYIVLSGLIFGLLHMMANQSVLEFFFLIPYSALGMAFAKMYYDSNNIWVNIFFHSFHNFICILIIFIGWLL